jgi:hypothetical protein
MNVRPKSFGQKRHYPFLQLKKINCVKGPIQKSYSFKKIIHYKDERLKNMGLRSEGRKVKGGMLGKQNTKKTKNSKSRKSLGRKNIKGRINKNH